MDRSANPLGLAILAFVSGFLAVLIFHQGLLAILHEVTPSAPAPWSMRGVPPFEVPAVISAAFWGGIWAMVLGHLLRGLPTGPAYWLTWIVVGAVALSVVAWVVVIPLKGMRAGNGWHPAAVGMALAVNGAWGLGTAIFLRLFGVQRAK